MKIFNACKMLKPLVADADRTELRLGLARVKMGSNVLQHMLKNVETHQDTQKHAYDDTRRCHTLCAVTAYLVQAR